MGSNRAVLASLIADSYALGAHWIYDEAQLEALDIDWQTLNAPKAMWHEGKEAGDFTHYGDHTLWLIEYLEGVERFDPNEYALFWKNKMQGYQGYVDASSRETLVSLEGEKPAACGPNNQDLSICGRIAPLLEKSSDENDFLANVVMFVKVTHNSQEVIDRATFLAKLLYALHKGEEQEQVITAILESCCDALQIDFQEIMQSLDKDSIQAIRDFGPACGVVSGFKGAMHIFLKYDDFTEAMIINAKAGGDSAARGMVIGMLMGAKGIAINDDWHVSMKHKLS